MTKVGKTITTIAQKVAKWENTSYSSQMVTYQLQGHACSQMVTDQLYSHQKHLEYSKSADVNQKVIWSTQRVQICN